MRFAYADPPYLGCAGKLYGDATYDQLDAHLDIFHELSHFDAWAFSLNEPSLRDILSICPENARVGVWVKPFASFKPGVDPAYTWEPVIFETARRWKADVPTARDHVSASITLEKGLAGAKPEKFCFWIFDLLGARPGDEFVDLFPGTGAVTAAWESFQRQNPLPIHMDSVSQVKGGER